MRAKPYVSNYPPLKAWLDKHDAVCNWQLPVGPKGDPNAYVESYRIKNRALIVVVYGNNNGWEIYTDCASNRIDDTLQDAEKRLGLRNER